MNDLELTNTAILAVLELRPEWLAEAHITAAWDALDRETLPSHVTIQQVMP